MIIYGLNANKTGKKKTQRPRWEWVNDPKIQKYNYTKPSLKKYILRKFYDNCLKYLISKIVQSLE